jgi:CRISPR-associated protein Csd2
VLYGFYRTHGLINARLANNTSKGTGFSVADLALLWEALATMFDHDRAAARGNDCARDNDLGNAPVNKLLERVTVSRAEGDGPPRRVGDYTVTVNEADLPAGITVEHKI